MKKKTTTHAPLSLSERLALTVLPFTPRPPASKAIDRLLDVSRRLVASHTAGEPRLARLDDKLRALRQRDPELMVGLERVIDYLLNDAEDTRQ